MRVAVLFLLLVALIARPALAQSAAQHYSGRTIASIRVSLEGQPATDETLLALVETQPGQTLSMTAVRESIARLYSLGRFQDVQVEATEAGDDGVDLHFDLIPIHAVERVEFRGSIGLSQGQLRSTVEERFGRTPEIGRAAEVERVLERLYQDRGYFRASVRAVATELENPHRTILTFQIESGPQARVGTIEIDGDPLTPRETFLSRLELAPGRPYDRETLQSRLTEYADRLKERGRLQATASHTARVAADGRTADVVVDVQPGPLVTVTFAGDPLPKERREALVPFQREGSVDEDLIEDASRRIRDYLVRQGYWKADVSVERQQTGEGLTIAFTVRRGPLYKVSADGVRVTGNDSMPMDEIRPLLVLAPDAPYVSSYLEAIRGAVLRLYRARGFAWVEVETREEEAGAGAGEPRVRPTIAITEGPRAVIGAISVSGTQALGERDVRRVLTLRPGAPYYEPMLRADRDAVELEYRNLGFAGVQVTLAPTLAADRTRVDLAFQVVEGPQTLIDHVIIVGNRRTAEDVIRRELLLKPGAPLGLRDLLESRRRLSQLGLFRRIDIRELDHGPSSRRDVLVTVEEAPATTVGYGGGLEVSRRLRATGPGGLAQERLELAPRGFFDIGRRNLGGKNRSVSLFTRVSVRPKDAPEDPDADGRGFGFSEYRIVGTYREPRAFGTNADFSLTGAVEQGVRSSFNFARKGVTAEVGRRLTSTIRGGLRYSFGTTRTFDERLSDEEQATIDRLFPQVRLSMFSAVLTRDTRDDVVEPAAGMLLSAESSTASRALGGQVGFIKTYMQGLWFTRLPGARRVVFATRTSVGLADGFPREADPLDPAARPIEDLPASERFFAGGDTSIRGFALDTVGVPKTISPRGFPRGGNAVLLMNGELRVPVWREFGAAFFVDGGNVFERVTDFDFSELRGSLGFGLRYRSPIGPIRVDLGFKMDRREFAGVVEPRTVLHFSIGQAF
jgi:outer membrane protein assembly factor BamA